MFCEYRPETNRTVTRFEHHGKRYKIHERASSLSDGSRYKRRFILDEDGDHCGEANTIREARKVLDARSTSEIPTEGPPATPGPA